MMKNLKTMFNVMNEFKKSYTTNNDKVEITQKENNDKINDNYGPTFFI